MGTYRTSRAHDKRCNLKEIEHYLNMELPINFLARWYKIVNAYGDFFNFHFHTRKPNLYNDMDINETMWYYWSYDSNFSVKLAIKQLCDRKTHYYSNLAFTRNQPPEQFLTLMFSFIIAVTS